MKFAMQSAVVALACAAAFSVQAQIANTTHRAAAGSGALADQVNWLDFTGFSRAAAAAAAGQAFTQTLPDGGVLRFTARVTGASTDVAAVIQGYYSPSYFGTTTALTPDHPNGFYTNVSGNPQLRTAGANATITLSDMTYTAAGGAAQPYRIVAVDAETTGRGESIAFTSSGSAWQAVDNYLPAHFTTVLTLGGTTATVSRNSSGLATVAGVYLLASDNPTSVSAVMTLNDGNPGAEGVAFGVVPLPRAEPVPVGD